MQKISVIDDETGQMTQVYAQPDFMAECAAYCYDRTYKQFLNVQRMNGASPSEAIAALREKLGAVTKAEKKAAWEARLDGWRKDRAERGDRGPGRPKAEQSLREVKARLAAGMFDTIAKIEQRAVSSEARELLDGTKKQLASW